MTQTTAPAFTHSLPCIEQTAGKAVLSLFSGQTRTEITYSEFSAMFSTAQAGFSCDCGKRELGRIEDSLRIIRKREKALRNSPAFGSRDYSIVADLVDELVAKRAAIRAELAR